MKATGLRLRINGEELIVHPRCTDDPTKLGRHDFMIVALKAHQAYGNARRFAPLLGPETAVVTASNGLPWWYFYKLRGRFENRRLESVDRGGRQWNAIGPNAP